MLYRVLNSPLRRPSEGLTDTAENDILTVMRTHAKRLPMGRNKRWKSRYYRLANTNDPLYTTRQAANIVGYDHGTLANLLVHHPELRPSLRLGLDFTRARMYWTASEVNRLIDYLLPPLD